MMWSLYIASSNNINIKDSSFIGARAVGVNLRSISNVHLQGVFVADVRRRDEISDLDGAIDKEACIAFCSYWEPNSCYDSSITYSIAAGCMYGGFVAPGHDCGDTESQKFRNNVAHSIAGAGAYIYPDPAVDSHKDCYEGSHFSAYKNQENGVEANYISKKVHFHDMTFIDNKDGLNINANGETDSQLVMASDMKIYG